MPDIYSRKKRSQIMSKITGSETGPEILVRSFLHLQGFRFRKNDKKYAGKPDIVLPKYRTIIFVHGCFWHGHNCSAGKLPETNVRFWKKKINSNVDRDKKNKRILKKDGWQVLVIWQCKLKNETIRNRTLNRLVQRIHSAKI